MIPNLRIYLYAAALIALLGFGVYVRHLQHKAALVDQAHAETRAAVAANFDQQTTIDTQAKALKSWVFTCGDSKEKELALVAAKEKAEQTARAAESKLAAAMALKESDRAIPACAALLKSSVTVACPATASSLRNAARH